MGVGGDVMEMWEEMPSLIYYYYYRERRGVEGQERVEEERQGPNQEQSVSNGWSGKGE